MKIMSEAEIIDVICASIAEEKKIDKDKIDINLPISKLEMDSLAVTELCVNLEKLLSIPVKPYIAWDYPTIAKMAAFLATQHSG
jgi:acyl carrier protein